MKSVSLFQVRPSFINNDPNAVSPLFEITPHSLTFAKDSRIFNVANQDRFYLFKATDTDPSVTNPTLTSDELDAIVAIKTAFDNAATIQGVGAIKNNLISGVIFEINQTPLLGSSLTFLDYTELTLHNGLVTAKELEIEISARISVRLWSSDLAFQASYPFYEIDIVLPFTNFGTLLGTNIPQFKVELLNIRPDTMHIQLEAARTVDVGGITRVFPPTFTRIIDVPFRDPSNPTINIPCYFGFNIYGPQGAYDDILRDRIREHLRDVLGFTDPQIDNFFPTLNQVNEFFFVPHWDNIAVPFNNSGENGIFSQMVPHYQKDFDLLDYFTIFDEAFVLENSYDFPMLYRNILITAINGKYSIANRQDFREYYSDLISQNSFSGPDLNRLNPRTVDFITMMEHILEVAIQPTSLLAYSKAMAKAGLGYVIRVRERFGVEYISIRRGEHYFYVIPRYEYNRIRDSL